MPSSLGVSLVLLAAACHDTSDAVAVGGAGGTGGAVGTLGGAGAGTAGETLGGSSGNVSAGTEANCATLPTSGCVNAGGLGRDDAAGPGMLGEGDTGGPDAGASPSAPDAGGGPAVVIPPLGFSPCPDDGSACVIMPFGDSITEGFPSFDGGYRVELFHQAVLGSHSITFVGDRANGPQTVDGLPFPRGSEGYSGYTIDASVRNGISARAEPAILAYRPHIILLMIGTNDIDLQVDVAGAPARLGALLDRITTAAPEALLVVATILPTTNAVTNERIRAYDAAIPGLVESRRVAGKHVASVDMYAAFTSNPSYASALMVDALHPNVAGYAVLGANWYSAILPYLPEPR